MVKVDKGTVKLTEHELRTILQAVEQGKDSIGEFIDEPIPEEDMPMEQYTREQVKRGTFSVTCGGGRMTFEIDCSGNCESRGFFLKS